MRLLRPYNPLVYPGGLLPGFDPSHPAANSCVFSGIASPRGGFLNLLTGAPGTIAAGAPTGKLYGAMGTATYWANADMITFPANSPGTFTNATFGAIFEATQFNANFLFAASSATSGNFWKFSTNNSQIRLNANSLVGSGITQNNVDPYFVAASASGSATYFVALNLKTGALQTSIQGGGSWASTSNGTFCVGNWHPSNNNNAANGIAAVMCSPFQLSFPGLLAWAADPWSFWYPQAMQQVMFSGLIAPTAPSLPTQYLFSQVCL